MLLVRPLRRLRYPGYGEARRRLERVNEMPHRPLESLDDSVAGGDQADALARAMWQRHQERLRARIGRLRIGLPRPQVLRLDRYSLRFAVAVALLLAALDAGDAAPERLLRALLPSVSAGDARLATLDAWVTPPDYTGRPPLFLAGNAEQPPPDGPIEVPQGSLLVAQVSHAGAVPQIAGPDGSGDDGAFQATAADSFRAGLPLDRSGRFAVRADGRELGAWDIVVIPDAAPTVAFLQPPGPTPMAALRIDFEAHDDYGLTAVTATIRRPDGAIAAGEPIVLDLPLPGLNMRDAAGTGYHDLTPHPWAGLEVRVQLVARDARGQTGASGAIAVTLPEREFRHPVARAIIEQRKRLTADPLAMRHPVGAELKRLARDAEAYDSDVVVFMALSTASSRLKHGSADDTVAAVQKLLWDTALRLEDGGLSLAARDLRRLQQELLDALARDAPDAELERLMDELEAALNELFDALARLQPQDMENMPLDPNAMMLDRQDLQALMDRMRDLMRGGARDAARQMLSELQNMLESLQAGRMGQPSQQFQQGMESLNALQELLEAQEELLNRTYEESLQRGQDGRQGQGGEMAAESALQEAMRRQLGEIMRQLGEVTGEIPNAFGRAEGAMRRSTRALDANRPGAAVPPQTEALDQLREGAREATEQMMQQFGGTMNAAGQGQPSMQPAQNDPFGRRTEGSQGTTQSDVDIPTETDLQKARRILEELRRRAGERDRPPVERDYIERLLEPY